MISSFREILARHRRIHQIAAEIESTTSVSIDNEMLPLGHRLSVLTRAEATIDSGEVVVDRQRHFGPGYLSFFPHTVENGAFIDNEGNVMALTSRESKIVLKAIRETMGDF